MRVYIGYTSEIYYLLAGSPLVCEESNHEKGG